MSRFLQRRWFLLLLFGFSGLEDQLLGLVVAEERPDLEDAKNHLIVSNAKMKQELKEIEDKILVRLSTSQGSPVDDIDLIQTLEASKIKSQEIKVSIFVFPLIFTQMVFRVFSSVLLSAWLNGSLSVFICLFISSYLLSACCMFLVKDFSCHFWRCVYDLGGCLYVVGFINLAPCNSMTVFTLHVYVYSIYTCGVLRDLQTDLQSSSWLHYKGNAKWLSNWSIYSSATYDRLLSRVKWNPVYAWEDCSKWRYRTQLSK